MDYWHLKYIYGLQSMLAIMFIIGALCYSRFMTHVGVDCAHHPYWYVACLGYPTNTGIVVVVVVCSLLSFDQQFGLIISANRNVRAHGPFKIVAI